MNLSREFIAELGKRFAGDLRLDNASKILYSTDASMYQIEPLGVAIPKTQDDLQAAVELAAKYKIPILPRGSGSSLGGQAIGEALILDCSRYLKSILEINPEEKYALVEPGVILTDLNRAAEKYGLTFGPDPASAERATMGGVIGNNATGAHSILYGMSADHLLAADVILSDGSLSQWGAENSEFGIGKREATIISAAQEIQKNLAQSIKEHYPKSWRNSAGYRLNYLLPWSPSAPPQWRGDYPNPQPATLNLAPLLAGSEGTLAVIRQMKVNLVAKPKRAILGVLQYENIEAACDDVPRLLEFNPSAIELIPQMILHLARGVPAAASQMGWIVGDPAAVLVVEFSGDESDALKRRLRTVGGLLTVAESLEQQNQIWNIRKLGLGILDSRPQTARPIAFIEDCAIPIEGLSEFAREIQRILQAHDTYAGIYAHASGGCLHIRPVLDMTRGEGVRAMRSIVEQVFALVFKLGGSMSSEHGDGIVSGEFIERAYGKEITDAMRKLKRAADPDDLLNPRKMFDAPPMDSNLRYGEKYRVNAWNSALHFDHERGLAGAIEQCNGQGVCRKSAGVMCPSFQASGDERLSTRGRANLLRALIKARGADDGIESELEAAAFETLDQCLACKGCTSECPSGVDMPKLKYEFMHHYYQSRRRPLRDYLFAYFHVVAKALTPVAPLANALMRAKPSKKIISKVFGISEARPLPTFKKSKRARESQNEKIVLFLTDVFSEYVEPSVKEAALEILHLLGYRARQISVVGAGAAFLSKGFVEQAQRHAERVLDEVKSFGADVAVVGCEPPEVYCIKQEYAALLPHRKAEIEALSKRVFMLDEFILRVASWEQWESNQRKSKEREQKSDDDKSTREKIFFHPHCHHRAAGFGTDGQPTGVSATLEVLRRLGFDVELSDAGCCGMAGTFGFDAEHYDLSMQIGELKLLPKARELQGARIVSSGSACRMQIRDGAGREALHPLELMQDRIANRSI